MRIPLIVTGIATILSLSCMVSTQSGTPGIIQSVTYEFSDAHFSSDLQLWYYETINVRADFYAFEDADAQLIIHGHDKEMTMVDRIDRGDIVQVVFVLDYTIYEGDFMDIRVESYIGGEQVDEWSQDDIEVPPAIG